MVYGMNHVQKALKTHWDFATEELHKASYVGDVEKFQWNRGYICALALALELIADCGYGGENDEDERHPF